MKSPKERFRENADLIRGYNDRIDSAQMTAAFDAAMMQLSMSFGIPNDPQVAAANGYRLQGARMYLANLLTLNTSEMPTSVKEDTNLIQT